jgi:hypothetical protein
MLRVSRADFLAMRRDGHVWSTGIEDIRHDGLSDARTLCTQDVAEIRVPQYKNNEKKTVFAIYHSALCASCADDERDNRATLSERFAGSR